MRSTGTPLCQLGPLGETRSLAFHFEAICIALVISWAQFAKLLSIISYTQSPITSVGLLEPVTTTRRRKRYTVDTQSQRQECKNQKLHRLSLGNEPDSTANEIAVTRGPGALFFLWEITPSWVGGNILAGILRHHVVFRQRGFAGVLVLKRTGPEIRHDYATHSHVHSVNLIPALTRPSGIGKCWSKEGKSTRTAQRHFHRKSPALICRC
jgi:hypothetical protein